MLNIFGQGFDQQMVASGSNPRVHNGAHSVNPTAHYTMGHGNAEGSEEANSSGPVETQRPAGHEMSGHSEHPQMLTRPASHVDEGIVRTTLKSLEHPSPHLHHKGLWTI